MRRLVRIAGGLRPLALAVLGAGWVWYGQGIITDPRYGTARGLAGLTRYIPLSALGWLWVAAGAVAVAAGVARRFPCWQAAGFAALAAPAFLWGLSFIRTAVFGGYPSASGSAAAWTAFAVFVVLVAGLAEPGWVIEALRDRPRAGDGGG